MTQQMKKGDNFTPLQVTETGYVDTKISREDLQMEAEK